MVADVYVGTSGKDIEFGDYKKMEGKGGADVLTSYASVFTKIYGDGGGDTLAYIGNDWAK
ncbi:MAG: hypothetical protein GY798_23775, partial [Hyphomicrobiales bacterium]|nr:hypothetical protein [Hyphomicrobiales bacterium]